MLLYDIDDENLFAASLRDEFKAAADASGGRLSITVLNRYDTEADLNNQFGTINGDLCGHGAPDTVLYAGRAALLDRNSTRSKPGSPARVSPSPEWTFTIRAICDIDSTQSSRAVPTQSTTNRP
jgi:hypothetical protein